MQGHVADVFGVDEAQDHRSSPTGSTRSTSRRSTTSRALRARFADPTEKLVLLIGRLVYEKGFQIALDALPRVIARLDGVRFLVAGSGTARGRAQGAGAAPRARAPRQLPGLDRRRRAALALPDRRPVRGAVDLRAVRAGRPRGDGQRLPVHRGRHRRPARGRAQRGRRPALPLARPALAGADDGVGPGQPGAALPPRHRGLRPRRALRLGRRRPAHRRGLRRPGRAGRQAPAGDAGRTR